MNSVRNEECVVEAVDSIKRSERILFRLRCRSVISFDRVPWPNESLQLRESILALDLDLYSWAAFEQFLVCKFLILLESGCKMVVKYDVVIVEQIHLILTVLRHVLDLGDAQVIRVPMTQAVRVEVGNRFQSSQDDLEWLIWFDNATCHAWCKLSNAVRTG